MEDQIGHPRLRMIGGGIALFIAVAAAIWFLILGPRQQQITDLTNYIDQLQQHTSAPQDPAQS
ncbi:MAG: hypothetical protein PHN51_10495 [Candidatus Nanopelagicales bacterium]|nr:hypothetical protein [Candidatus Nanopelagicales bacterium]